MLPWVCRADVLQMYGDWIYNKIRWDSSEGIYFLCRGTCLKVGCSLSLRGPCSSFGCRILPSIFHSSYQHRNSPNCFISSFIFILIRQRYHLILDRIIYHLYIADSHKIFYVKTFEFTSWQNHAKRRMSLFVLPTAVGNTQRVAFASPEKSF